MTDIAIKVPYLSKCYQIHESTRDRHKQFVAPPLQRLTWQKPKHYFLDIWALKAIYLKLHLVLHAFNYHTLGG